MASWILIDIDKIDQATYNRMSRRPGAFFRPSDGALAVPVDTKLTEFALHKLHAEGVPLPAMRIAS